MSGSGSGDAALVEPECTLATDLKSASGHGGAVLRQIPAPGNRRLTELRRDRSARTINSSPSLKRLRRPFQYVASGLTRLRVVD